jgi:hypothetical protein
MAHEKEESRDTTIQDIREKIDDIYKELEDACNPEHWEVIGEMDDVWEKRFFEAMDMVEEAEERRQRNRGC